MKSHLSSCALLSSTHKLRPCAWLQVRAKQEESDRQAAEVARLHATTPEQLYHADLDAFEAALDERDEEEAREAELLVTQRGRAGRAGSGKAGSPGWLHSVWTEAALLLSCCAALT